MAQIGIDARLTYYRDGGISTYIQQMVKALAQIDHDHAYTVFHSRKDQRVIEPTLGRKALWTPAHHRFERVALSMELAWRGLDVFHSPDFIPPHRGAKRHVITVHDLTFLHYPNYLTSDSRTYYNAQIEQACQDADHILAVSAHTRHDLIEILSVPENKITVQPHGVNPHYRPLPIEQVEPVQKALNLPDTYILHVGTWEPRKNIIGLLRAYRHLLADMPDLPPVVLVGREGWLFQQTRAEIDTLGINQHVIWRDQVSDVQLPAVYNRALVNVNLSHYEGFGMPSLEGMACGIVPIVSDRSSLPEVVGDVGLCVPPDDTIQIAEALKHALIDQAWRGEQAQLALARAQQFTWERSAQIARNTYTALL
ncbi:MAG: glycosyltransferase family 4 protein [Anaerolineae bacterium]